MTSRTAAGSLPSPERCADLAGRAQQVVDRVPSPLPVQPLGGAAHGEHAEELVARSVDPGGDAGQAFLLLVPG